MVLKLDPRWPLVWRNPFSVQLGVDPPLVRLDDLSDTEERMLSALTVGVSLPGLTLIAHGRIADRDWLLKRLAPALLADERQAPVPLVAVTGTAPLVGELAKVLASSGVRVVVAESAEDLEQSTPDLAVVVGDFVLAPVLHSVWLRRDIPHIPVVSSDTGVVIGPVVEPGDGPCLLCLELHRRDEDAAWPAIATQLLGRRTPAQSPLLVIETAAALTRMTLSRLQTGAAAPVAVRIDATTGERSRREWQPHPECGCRGLARLVAVGATTSHRPESGSPGVAQSGPALR